MKDEKNKKNKESRIKNQENNREDSEIRKDKKQSKKFFDKKKKKEKISYEEMEGMYKRALADYQNLLKRSAEEKQEFIKYANEQIVMEILPVYDNLKESLKHIGKGTEENNWAKGIEFVVKQFKDTLANIGVTEIEAKGKKFDPNKMEAVEGKGEKVVKILKSGYELNGKIIIPARVALEKIKN